MVSNIGLESIYLIVGSLKLIAGGSKLICKFLSGLSCLSEIRLNCTSSPGDEPKNCIPRPVQHIRRTGIFRFKFIRNSGFKVLVIATPELSQPQIFQHIEIQAYAI
jgi:hypothetical protein